MDVQFKAQIKSVNTKQLVSGDQSTRITLEADLNGAGLAAINELIKNPANASQELNITIEA